MGPFKADMAAVAGEGEVFDEEGYLWSVACLSCHTYTVPTRTHFGHHPSLVSHPSSTNNNNPNRCSQAGFLPDRQEARLCALLRGVQSAGVAAAVMGALGVCLYLVLGFRSMKLKCVRVLSGPLAVMSQLTGRVYVSD